MLYATTLVFAKTSIHVSVLRIATGKAYIFTLRIPIRLPVLLSTVGLIVVPVKRRPTEAFWDPSKGT